MSNSSPGILISELTSGDGPYARVADDFLHRTCSRCGQPVEGDFVLLNGAYHCRECMSRSWRSATARTGSDPHR